ncbi:MAG: radical SAM protein [Clostridia bacterium]|nr:radical SAM protein [Clostridia bacterium]
MTAPIIGISRHRMASDGAGVTTLVGFHGCPLRCRYCLNPHSFAEDSKRLLLSPEELYERVKVDQLYFLATGGGVTFGGGEPLLYPAFLKEFRRLCGPHWRLYAETSLSVPWESVEMAAEVVDEFIVDCKDTDGDIYRRYTGQSNEGMLENLARLVALVGAERVTVRLPLIPAYNNEEDREKSAARLASLGVRRFDRFTYKTEGDR